MLTYDQATYFLESVLRMPPTWRNLLQEKPLEFFTLYLKRHAIRVPFQNMYMASVEEGHRWFPSEEEIKNIGLSGRGGCCLHLNYFTKMVFQAIGVDSFVVRGDHYCAPVAGTHCMAMVRLHGPKHTGLYMIEVGGAYPMLEPVPMDKEKLPFRTLQAVGYPYEFREIGKGWIGKFHIGGGIMGGKFTDKKETLRTYWELKPRAHWEFDYPMLETFTNPSYSVVLRAPYVYRFFSNTEFQRLFPELPENAGANIKEKVLVTKSISKIEKVIAANKSKLGECKVFGGLVPSTNGKVPKTPASNGKPAAPAQNGKPATVSTPATNGKALAPASTAKDKKATSDLITSSSVSTNGKESVELTLSKMEIVDSDEDEFEVVTEEEVESDEDEDLEDPKNFIFVFKRRLVVGDAHSRKVIKNYSTYVEMSEDLKKYFPKIPSKVIDKAIKTFSAYEPLPNPYDSIL